MIYPYDYDDDRYGYWPVPLKRPRHGLMNAESRTFQKNLTDPMHLFDWPQVHHPPRCNNRGMIEIVGFLHQRRPVADALFPRARQRLIIAFFMHPQNIYRQTDLMRITGLRGGSGQREIMNLRVAGLIRETRGDHQLRPYLQAETESPLFSVMCALAQAMLYTPWQSPFGSEQARLWHQLMQRSCTK